MKEKILLVEDDEILRTALFDKLKKCGWQVDQAENGHKALALIEHNFYRLVLSDIRMPGMDGTLLLEEIMKISPETDVILMTAYGSAESAVSCLKKGAADYILKPFDMDDLVFRLVRLLKMQSLQARCVSLEKYCEQHHSHIIGSSTPIRSMLELIGQVANSDSTVLITGETGTGKELVANAIVQSSRRSSAPYIRVNCAAIPDGLLESELFGHEKGAFTSADSRKIGRFELADGGTILLDEVGEMPMHLQPKILRVLQEREFERVGGSRTIKIDVRVICATARDLLEEVKKGAFREDLYYRLQVIPIRVPPLRERKEDIVELSYYFLEEFNLERATPLKFSRPALQLLASYDFPGNIRELRNLIERLSVMVRSPVIEPQDMPVDLKESWPGDDEAVACLADVLARAEKTAILKALGQTKGKKLKAASLLGISRKCLWEKMKLHKIKG